MPIRLRYVETFTFAYHSLAGELLARRQSNDEAAIDEAFGVMERLRGRGLTETLLAGSGSGSQIQPPTLQEIQGRLEPAEAMLSFQVWRAEPTLYSPYREGSSWLTVVTRDRVQAFRIPDADVLEPRIRAWTGLLERRDGSDRLPGAGLHEDLLGPALDALPPQVNRLIIVPDGPLHRLPFDALSPRGGPYVAERFQISIVPSASLWVRFRSAPARPPGRILVLADPTGPGAVLAVRRDASTVLGALVHARGEAEVAAASFPGGSELRRPGPTWPWRWPSAAPGGGWWRPRVHRPGGPSPGIRPTLHGPPVGGASTGEGKPGGRALMERRGTWRRFHWQGAPGGGSDVTFPASLSPG